jgi:Undecaprenyl-phosphate glucose phosphotransferase
MAEVFFGAARHISPGASTGNVFSNIRRKHMMLYIDALRGWDALVILFAGYASLYQFGEPATQVFSNPAWHYAVFAALLMPVYLSWSKAYAYEPVSRIYGLRSILGGFFVAMGVSAIAAMLCGDLFHFPARSIVLFSGLSVGLLWAPRFALGALFIPKYCPEVMSETIAIVGAGERADRLIEYIKQECRGQVEVAGVFDDRICTRAEDGKNMPVGNLDELIQLTKDRSLAKIVIALPLSAEHRLLQIVHKLNSVAIDVELCPDNVGFSLLRRRSGSIGELPLLRISEAPLGVWAHIVKRMEDIIIAGTGLIVLSPILLAIACAIKLTSPGPILFRQKRYGFNNEPIEVLKFRSMFTHMTDYDARRQATRDDPRITPVGRFLRKSSLDELPQLFNVLQGSMSIVGPRPHAIGMRTNNLLCEEIVETYTHRHRVKPGITGWAQVNGSRGATDTTEQLERRVQLDLHYIENWSLALDLKIIVMTVFSIINDKNAY